MNEAVTSRRPSGAVQAAGAQLMRKRNVTPCMARDLQSQSTQPPDARDFDHIAQYMPPNRKLDPTKLSGRAYLRTEEDIDTRSLASEYDYGQKKKFTDIFANHVMRNRRGTTFEHEMKSHLSRTSRNDFGRQIPLQ